MTRQNYFHIEMLGDRTGSMGIIKTDAEGGMRSFIDEQRHNADSNEGRTITFGYRQFDWDPSTKQNSFDQVQSPVDIHQANYPEILPRGNTPLYDAIGWAVTDTGLWLQALPESSRPEKVFFVIQTDGLENYSSEWTKDRIAALIKEQEERYNWDFVYLGANQDAMVVGQGIGVRAASTVSYSPTGQSTRAAYAAASEGVTASMNTGAKTALATTDVREDDDPSRQGEVPTQ